MKKILIIITIACLFTACKSNSKSDLQTNKVMLTDTTAGYSNDMTTDVGKTENERGKTNTAASTSHKSNTTVSSANNTSTATSTSTTTAKKKGWSNRAKGAVIGGAAGAVGGAIVSKHKGTGALIGGAVGAAGGYIIGNEKDKKNNR